MPDSLLIGLGAASVVDSRRQLLRLVHSLFAVLVLVVFIRASTSLIAGLAAALLVWYLGGIWLIASINRKMLQLWMLSVFGSWSILAVLISTEFVWLSFPLLFVCLAVFGQRSGSVLAVGMTLVSIGALAQEGLRGAEVVGPVLGGLVALTANRFFEHEMEEHTRTRSLLDGLRLAQQDLASSERMSGALQERQRLAREVHDTIAQSLSSIILLARSSQLSDQTDPALTLERVEDLARTALQDARQIVAALDPVELDELSLAGALGQIADRAALDSPTQMRSSIEGEPHPLDREVEIVFLRVAQGAIANVVAHAAAAEARISLTYFSDRAVLDIVDDGCGFDSGVISQAKDGTGHGIDVMRSRLREVGGSLAIESSLGCGTAVTASVQRPTS